MTYNPISRRGVLRVGGTVATAGAVAALTSDWAVDAMATPGQARTFDLDGNGERDQQFDTVAEGPDGRSDVLHATTDRTATTDYAVTLADMTSRQVTLGDLAAEGIAYDYYVDDGETGMAPDEVVLVVHTGRQDGGRHLVFRTEDETRAREGGTWRTRDVSVELTGDTSLPGIDQQWKEFHPDGRRVERIGRDLLDRFGPGATVKGAGVGKGTPSTGEAVSDTYYDRFTVAGPEYDLPTTGARGRETGRGNS